MSNLDRAYPQYMPRFRRSERARERLHSEVETLIGQHVRPTVSRLAEIKSAELLGDVATLERLCAECRGADGEQASVALARARAGVKPPYHGNTVPTHGDPSLPLRAKAEKYARAVARGLPQRAAYLTAYTDGRFGSLTYLRRDPKVSRRIEWLKANGIPDDAA